MPSIEDSSSSDDNELVVCLPTWIRNCLEQEQTTYAHVLLFDLHTLLPCNDSRPSLIFRQRLGNVVIPNTSSKSDFRCLVVEQWMSEECLQRILLSSSSSSSSSLLLLPCIIQGEAQCIVEVSFLSSLKSEFIAQVVDSLELRRRLPFFDCILLTCSAIQCIDALDYVEEKYKRMQNVKVHRFSAMDWSLPVSAVHDYDAYDAIDSTHLLILIDRIDFLTIEYDDRNDEEDDYNDLVGTSVGVIRGGGGGVSLASRIERLQRSYASRPHCTLLATTAISLSTSVVRRFNLHLIEQPASDHDRLCIFKRFFNDNDDDEHALCQRLMQLTRMCSESITQLLARQLAATSLTTKDVRNNNSSYLRHAVNNALDIVQPRTSTFNFVMNTDNDDAQRAFSTFYSYEDIKDRIVAAVSLLKLRVKRGGKQTTNDEEFNDSSSSEEKPKSSGAKVKLIRDLITPSRGILLHGPPGMGKTKLMRCISRLSDSGSVWLRATTVISKYVGESERAIREVFNEARQRAIHGMCVVCIDEIDALFGSRDEDVDGDAASTAHTRTIATLLTEMDGINEKGNVMVVATTSRIDLVDSALQRPGRFDLLLRLSPPTNEQRGQILRHLLSSMKTNTRLLEFVANNNTNNNNNNELIQRTDAYTCADLVDLCNRAALLAVEAVSPVISIEHLLGALEQKEASTTIRTAF